MKVQEKKDRQSGRHYTTLDTAQEIRILLGMYRRREGGTDGRTDSVATTLCLTALQLLEYQKGAARKDINSSERLPLASYTLVWSI